MSTLGLVNIGAMASGILDTPTLDADSLLVRDGRIAAIGNEATIGARDADFAEMARHGVRHAKYGFGGYAHPRDGEPEVRLAQKHGLCVQSHSGGTSIPGSSPIDHEMLLHIRPDVAGHVNGGTTSLDDEALRRLIHQSDIPLHLLH